MARDEMVDGRGGIRPHWRSLVGVLTGLGHAALAERAERLDRTAAEEGVGSLLPGAPPDPWRFDPVPLPLPEAEFARLEAGLAQRARLLDALLGDVYGPQRLLADGALPPALVYANPRFLRPCRRIGMAPQTGLMRFYAADLLRGEDGSWLVAADHTGWADGLAQALENRRRLGRVVPELFATPLLSPLEPFAELLQDAMQRLTQAGGQPGGVALLTAGPGDPGWYGHVLVARELACALVEGGDLTVRSGGLFLKTLRGLQPITVLMRAVDGRRVDPLELDPEGGGVPGLLAVARGGLRIVNDPGTGYAEAPALAAFLPALAQRLLGEELVLPSVPTLWLGDPAAQEMVRQAPEAWRLRPAFGGELRAPMPDAVAAAPWRFAASASVTPSVAPCLGGGTMQPRPVMIRLFLIYDRGQWRAMPGGLGVVLPDGAVTWPARQLRAKDVWVLAETPEAVAGPLAHPAPPLAIRRTAGDLPSRVADNFFWLGRYLERLEGAARLARITLARLSRPALAPHELVELEVLASCLAQAGLLNVTTIAGLGPAGLRQALLRAVRSWGAVHALLGQVSRLSGLLRDRMTGEMHAVTTRGLREVETALEPIGGPADRAVLDAADQAMARVLAFAATVSGLTSENMVRGGGRLFLDLGRRIERAQAVADEVACALDYPGAAQQPARVEHGLRLALELRDSSITYRARYLAVVQPAPALDLLLADAGNPRGLAFQFAAMQALLAEIAGAADTALVASAAALQEEADAMVATVSAAGDPSAQEIAARALPPRLWTARDAVAELSDRLSRRYFALLPTARSVGGDPPDGQLRGAA